MCPHCGAIISIPLGAKLFETPIRHDFTKAGWVVIVLISLVLGCAVFFKTRQIATARMPTAGKEADAPAEQLVKIETGTIVYCDPCGALIENKTHYVTVPVSKAGKYVVDVVHTTDCNLCGTKDEHIGYEPENTQMQPVPGVTKNTVLSRWGKPIKREFYLTNGHRFERWYFGDPMFKISTQSRYVELNEKGEVINIHELDGF